MWDKKTLEEEFQRQVNNILDIQELSLVDEIQSNLQELKEKAIHLNISSEIPFVIVVKSSLVSNDVLMNKVIYKGQNGYINMDPSHPNDFKPISNLDIPDKSIYLITDIDTGKDDTLNVTPFNALKLISNKGRSPLTIDEGVSLLFQYPDIIKTKNAFSLLASRKEGKMVPAIWISYKKPRLGWCWENNPHTWLGPASCKEPLR